MFDTIRGSIRQYRSYRRTVTELSDLPDVMLNDIGIARHEIKHFARKSAKR